MNKLDFITCNGPEDLPLTPIQVRLTFTGEIYDFAVTNSCPHYVGQLQTEKGVRKYVCGISPGKKQCKPVIDMIDERIKTHNANKMPTLPDGREGRELEE